MHDGVRGFAQRSLLAKAIPARDRHFQRSHFIRFLMLLTALLLCSGIQTAKANETTPYLDQPMLSTLYTTYGEAAYQRGLRLRELLKRLMTKDIRSKLLGVDRFFNTFSYRSDTELWKTRDHWATPLEFLGKNGGDCEDFVISKYFALRALGVSDANLSLIYAIKADGGVPHMVLSYHDSVHSVPLILDTHGPDIRPASEHQGIIPIYGFNESSIFLTQTSFVPGRYLSSDRLRNNKWDELLAAVKRADVQPLYISQYTP
jgi:predicted transglutaminase-like cysteine proteinase